MPVFLINIIVGVVLSLASTLLQQAFAPKPQDQRRQTGTRGAAQIGGKVPQYFLMGTVGEAGKREYRNSWGEPGGVPNAYVTDVHSFGDLPITAMTGLYVNGVRVSIPTTGAVAQGYPVPEYSGHLWWKFFNGTQTAADSYLVSKFGGDTDRAWASDMIGVGIPYLITTALWSETLWTGFPSYVGEFQGIKLYDPRKDSTAGGSGSHRWGQPATYEFSDNNAVMIYNIERGIYYEGRHVWGGRKTAAEMPYAVWAAAMNACDEAVPLAGGGTEKRFRAGLRVNLNERPADVIRELLIGANARISHASDGTVYILVGVPTAPDFHFTDADVLATEPLGAIPFPNLDEIINGATATYREPLQAWEDKETAPYYRSDLEDEDDGRRQTEGLDLGTTFSGTQAQRILQHVIEDGRRFRRHVPALPPEFAQYRPLQVGAWTSERYGYVEKWFLITARTRDPWGNVVFGLQEIDPADQNWNPSTDEKPLSFAPVVTNRPPPQEVSGFYVEPAIWVDSQGRSRRPAIDVFWSSASVGVDVEFVRISYRLEGEAEARWVGVIPRPELLLGSARITEALLPNEDYEVQIQYIARSGRPTLASGWLAVTTPDIKLGPLDVVYGDIDLDELGEQIEGYFDWMGKGMREIIEQAQEQALLTGDQELANAAQFDEMRRSMSTVVGDLSASFDETITTAIIPMQGELAAIADQVTTLEATAGEIAASVTVRSTAQASPSEGWAGFGVEVKVDNGGDWAPAAFVIEHNGTMSRAVFSVNQFIINSGSVVATPFVFDGSAMRVANAFVGTASIQDAAITTAKIGDAQITAAKIGSAAITTAKIGDAAITSAKIADLSVGTGKIANLAVGTLQIANNAVTVSGADAPPGGSIWSTGPKTATVVLTGLTAGGVAQIAASAEILNGGGNADAYYMMAVYRNGTLLSRQRLTSRAEQGGDYPLEVSYLDVVPSAGNVTYTVTISTNFSDSGGVAHIVSGFRMVAMFNKK